MTTLIIWAGVDTHGQSSLNMASDSRITFTDGGVQWDQAQKVYAMKSQPIVMGFVGDVMFPWTALSTVASRIEQSFYGSDTKTVVESVVVAIRQLWDEYPTRAKADTEIYIGFRIGEGITCRFSLVQLQGSKDQEWRRRTLEMPSSSAELVIRRGTGREAFDAATAYWEAGAAHGTSRAVFSAFIDALESGKDSASGGAPQLASIYRKFNGIPLGIVYRNRRYFQGSAFIGHETVDGIEWRGPLFERLDGKAKKLLTGAQIHKR